MNLFNPKTLARHIRIPRGLPPEHLEILQNWTDLIQSGRIKSYKETALHGEFKSNLLEGVLGYKGPVADKEFTVATEQTILRGSVDLALGRFSKDNSDTAFNNTYITSGSSANSNIDSTITSNIPLLTP